MKKALALLASAAIVTSLAGIANAGKAVTVFEDPAGDADNNQSTGQSVPGGLDIVNGTIAKSGKDLVFTVAHADMPPTGSAGEGFRLLWQINVDGEEYRFTVKSLDVGKPDPVAGSGTDRVGTVYQGVARLEQCSETPAPAGDITLINCNPSEYYAAVFNVADKTVTWNVPLASLKAKVKSVIAGGSTGAAASSCQICWVPQAAERSLTPHTIIDSATQTVAYKVPKK